ncbi:MAG: helix-turn-helix domain-containing protein [Pseudobdellovibrionaceae bacterium]|nr:helix-turn-helix domain-containing protein [Pseudobdellovibrionaceae bacterium]
MKKKTKTIEVEFSFDKLTASLEEAIAHAKGEDVPVRISKVNPDQFVETIRVDRDFIKWFRSEHELSQKELADLFSVSMDTVKSWESKERKQPVSGAARRLFQVFALQPTLVNKFKEKKGA